MNNRVLSEQNNLPRRTHKPFPIFPLQLLFLQRQFLHRLTQNITTARGDTRNKSDIIILGEVKGDCTSVDERTLEVVKEVPRVLDAYTEADEVFGETAGCSGCRVYGCVSDK
jgi:hypothetical protein